MTVMTVVRDNSILSKPLKEIHPNRDNSTLTKMEDDFSILEIINKNDTGMFANSNHEDKELQKVCHDLEMNPCHWSHGINPVWRLSSEIPSVPSSPELDPFMREIDFETNPNNIDVPYSIEYQEEDFENMSLIPLVLSDVSCIPSLPRSSLDETPMELDGIIGDKNSPSKSGYNSGSNDTSHDCSSPDSNKTEDEEPVEEKNNHYFTENQTNCAGLVMTHNVPLTLDKGNFLENILDEISMESRERLIKDNNSISSIDEYSSCDSNQREDEEYVDLSYELKNCFSPVSLVSSHNEDKNEDEKDQAIETIENIVDIVSATSNDDKDVLDNVFTRVIKQELKIKVQLNQVSTKIAESAPVKEKEEIQTEDPEKTIEERKVRNRKHAKRSRERQKSYFNTLKKVKRELENNVNDLQKTIESLNTTANQLETLLNEHLQACGLDDNKDKLSFNTNKTVKKDMIEVTNHSKRPESNGSCGVVYKECGQQEKSNDDNAAIVIITTIKGDDFIQDFTPPEAVKNSPPCLEDYSMHSAEPITAQSIKTECESDRSIMDEVDCVQMGEVDEIVSNEMDMNKTIHYLASLDKGKAHHTTSIFEKNDNDNNNIKNKHNNNNNPLDFLDIFDKPNTSSFFEFPCNVWDVSSRCVLVA